MLPLYLGYINENDTLDTVYYKTSAALAFIGGTIFEVGSYLMVAEALNRFVRTFPCPQFHLP
jgi:hypothetical protein